MANPTLPQGLEARIEAIGNRLKQEEFYVLVWGSGEGNQAAYEKRTLIRDHLAASFGDENVRLSEDSAFQGYVQEYGEFAAEAMEAQAVDAVVIFDTSVGPHTELTKFEDILRGKSIVFVPHAHKESRSFAATAYDVLKVEGYTEEEFQSCNSIRRKANNFAQALRMKKFERQRFQQVWDSPHRQSP